MNGIVISGEWTEDVPPYNGCSGRVIPWEWLVLYEDGMLQGADTRDINVVDDTHE
jgi:hypothetical protein